jgi:hypothetical protein
MPERMPWLPSAGINPRVSYADRLPDEARASWSRGRRDGEPLVAAYVLILILGLR